MLQFDRLSDSESRRAQHASVPILFDRQHPHTRPFISLLAFLITVELFLPISSYLRYLSRLVLSFPRSYSHCPPTSIFEQVLTGDAWASEIARPLFQTRFDGPVVAFFGSFIVIVGWTLLQVVVAVLLEHFGAAANREKERALTQRAVEAGHSAPHFCTDPLMASLAHFDTNADLSQRIKTLFQALDTDESKTLSFRELQSGLRKLNFKPRIRLSEDDFDVLTISRTLCTASGEVDAISFERIMRHQLAVYVQRQVAVAMSLAPENDVNQTGTILFVLKLIKNGISEILDNGSGNGIIGCNGGSGSARSISKTEPEASLSSPVAGPARLGKINGCHPTLESMIAGLQHSMDLVLSKLKIDKEDSSVIQP